MRKLFLLALLATSLFADAHIFVYHRFGDAKHASTNTSLELLKSQFEYFKQNNYKVIPLATLTKAINEKQKIDDKWVVLTIDDSYKSFYNNGLALFKEYGYPFTLFVYVEATQRHFGDFMSWEQIREASKYGEIGLHSYAHRHMVSMTPQEVYADTKKAYEIFEKEMGFKPKSYVYPYGEFTPDMKKEMQKFGFDTICNQNAGAITSQSDVHNLDRTALTGESVLKSKLRIKSLQVEWIEPKIYPTNGILKNIHATIPAEIKNVDYYVSSYEWKHAKVVNGDVNITFNKPLKRDRSRLFLKYRNKQSAIVLVKP